MLPVNRVIGHREWAPGRKVDPLYDMGWRRAGVAGIRPRQEDDMFTDADRAKLERVEHEVTHFLPHRRDAGPDLAARPDDTVLGWADHAAGSGYRVEQRLGSVEAQLTQIAAMLAGLVAAHDPKGPGS